MGFNQFVYALAKYKPFVHEKIPQILGGIYIAIAFICTLVAFAVSEPPDYIAYAVFAATFTALTSLSGIAAHLYPYEIVSVSAGVFAGFSLLFAGGLLRIIVGEYNTCGKLYDNEAATAALFDRLDELSSASGSVVSASLLSAEASQQISHYSMLCMGLRYSDGWYRMHMTTLIALFSVTILSSLTTIVVTLMNIKGAQAWLEAHEHALMHLFHTAGSTLETKIRGLGSFIHHHTHHNHGD